jgi:bla regulator protein BlaR1
MLNWSQSHFLQSLGWATLNSFWQMAILWVVFQGASYFFRLSSNNRYQLAVGAILAGFTWFLFTFFYFFQSSPVSSVAIFNHSISESNSFLNMLLISSSVAYLSLLVFPSYKLYRNWKFVQLIKKEGLHKADLNYRLFVQKISSHLGIGKKVMVFLSDLVSSPVTVGYLKPVILLPVAALNHLSTQQVEAILLHELSHIRRFDYLINLLISIITTILYFNPFVKNLMRTIEEERENCCDQLVLQYGYDKVGYASALLSLEKAAPSPMLVLAASGKEHLLNRIEKIVGMERKKTFKVNNLAGIVASLLCIILFNSVLIIRDSKKKEYSVAYSDIFNPMQFYPNGDVRQNHSITPVPVATSTRNLVASISSPETRSPLAAAEIVLDHELLQAPEQPSQFMNVALDEVDASLTAEQREKVSSTVAMTKKVLASLQWKEIDKSIADAMSRKEKENAKMQYLRELDKTINGTISNRT